MKLWDSQDGYPTGRKDACPTRLFANEIDWLYVYYD
jgi:hypothetical protein